jgi:D-glycero-D-manno-heptose 1,7-bisphosphate phosphatase
MANKMEKQVPAVFFDRDGTLNVDTGYLHEKEKLQWMPEAREAVKYVNDMGYLAIVITNQSGVARGMFGEQAVRELHAYMNEQLEKIGAHLDGFYYCPHHPEAAVPEYRQDCACRKPKSGLIDKACQDFEIDLEHSLMVGDSPRDVECAAGAGVRGILYQGGSLLELVKKFISARDTGVGA